MRITVENNYLIFPVNTMATGKRLTFSRDNKTVYDLNIKIDYFMLFQNKGPTPAEKLLSQNRKIHLPWTARRKNP